eukprot:445417_1
MGTLRSVVISQAVWILSSQQIYVSKHGNDTVGCGETVRSACGTLYYASLLADNIMQASIILHDGQNSDIINNYFFNKTITEYNHPCLPITISYNLTLTFNDEYIHQMNDWFQKGVCYNNNHSVTQWANVNRNYFFNVDDSPDSKIIFLKINNLYLDNYAITPQVSHNSIPTGIFSASADDQFNEMVVTNTIQCRNCQFKNIHIRIDTTYSYSQPVFSFLLSSLHLINSTVVNVIYIGKTFINTEFGNVKLNNVSVVNSHFDSIFISFHAYYVDQSSYIEIQQSTFTDISTVKAIIFNEFWVSFIYIYDTIFDNIISGAIFGYNGQNPFVSDNSTDDNIDIANIFISTSQTRQKNELFALFNFGSAAKAVFRDITVEYYYDLFDNCFQPETAELCIDSIFFGCVPADTTHICHDPVPLIISNGNVLINGHNLCEITLTLQDFYEYQNAQNLSATEYEHFNLQFYGGHAWIENGGKLIINNLIIKELPFGNAMFESYGILSLYNITMIHSGFDPNMLQSNAIINLFEGSLTINNCSFIGGKYFMINASQSDSIYVSDSILMNGNIGMATLGVDQITITNCELYRLGTYYGAPNFLRDSFTDVETIIFLYSHIITFQENILSFFNPGGFMASGYNSNITMANNIFSVNYTHLFYNESNLAYGGIDSIILFAGYDEAITVTNNIFVGNDINSSIPWIYYVQNSGINCISGNHFTNVAFELMQTDLTSCSRPELSSCWNQRYKQCKNGSYGILNDEFYSKSTFIATESDYIWKLNDNYVALDNIEIVNTSLIITEGNVLLIESFLISNSSADIFYISSCDLYYNDRWIKNDNYISKLMVQCHGIPTINLNNSLSSPLTKFIRNFSPTKLIFSPMSYSYWPGTSLSFDYKIEDILGNVINDTFPLKQSSIIHVNNIYLSLSAPITIDEYGNCSICHSGIVLFGTNLIDKLGTFNISLQLESDYLTLENRFFNLEITGCPIGYGATENRYQCEKCPATTFNLNANNLEKCLPCDQSNKGIECQDGLVLIAGNHWIGLKADLLSSAVCSYGYCCQNDTQCNYIPSSQNNSLCAHNRDSNSYLCSECVGGYSHVFLSTQCKKCKGVNVIPMIMVMLLGLLIAMAVLLSNSEFTANRFDSGRERNSCVKCFVYMIKLRKTYFVMTLKLLSFQGIVYFEQSLSQVIIHSNVSTTKISWWISLLNLSILNGSSETEAGYCFYDGMTAKGAVLSGFMILIAIIVPVILCKCCLSSFRLFGYIVKPNYAKIFLFCLLLCIGKISSVLFSLLSCQTINNLDKVVHFYFGWEYCYGYTWLLALSGLVGLIVMLIILFIILYRMQPNFRQNKQINLLYPLVRNYKPEFYYWEFILLVRRIFTAFLSIAFVNNYSKLCLFLILGGYIFIQNQCQ